MPTSRIGMISPTDSLGDACSNVTNTGSASGSGSGTHSPMPGLCDQHSSPGSLGGRSTPKDAQLVSVVMRCPLCNDPFQQPKVLACFHTFCKPCLDRLIDSPGRIICPQCHGETQLCPDMGVDSLLSDYAITNMQDAAALESNNNQFVCTGCKSKDLSAVAYCVDCSNFLCNNCVMAHQYMHCFEGHHVKTLDEIDCRVAVERPVKCLQHKTDALKYFCFTCNIPLCQVCTQTDHPRGLHQWESISEISKQQIEYMKELLDQAKLKQRNLVQTFKSVDQSSQRLGQSYHHAQQQIADTAQLLMAIVEEQRQLALREVENAYNAKQMSLGVLDKKMQQTMEKLSQTIIFTARLLDHATPSEVLVFKKLLDTRLQAILNYNPDLNLQAQVELDFVTNPQTARLAIANVFGFVRQGTDLPMLGNKPLPIARPTTQSLGISGSLPTNLAAAAAASNSLLMNGLDAATGNMPAAAVAAAQSLLQAKQQFGSSNSLGPFSTISSDTTFSNYERWSNAGGETASFSLQNVNPAAIEPFYPSSVASGGAISPSSLAMAAVAAGGAHSPDAQQQIVDLTAKLQLQQQAVAGGGLGPGCFPPKSQIKRHKMIYHCKFGEFGVMEGQFTEPSGVAVNAQGDIVVADTNNHRIQVFDKEGRFKFHFGECGKRDGQLLYPNRVAVHRPTGEVVVTERSPTHQIQVYNQFGQFLRKFGANVLQHPRGVCVDHKGRVVIVECKVMRVLIFDLFGNVLQKFGCSKYLEFPNGVCASEKQEIFISDNRAHAVKVFSYDGQYLRQIGGEGITNYPIGVGINQLGEIVVADNHNNFNVTLFAPDGTLVSALESKVKHAQCFDVALMDDGSIVLASKDYRLYVYRYVQLPQLGM